jgi:hypothetical protein
MFSKTGLHTRECPQVEHTGGGHDRSRDAYVSEMLAAGRGTVEPPQVGGDTIDVASIRSLRKTMQNTDPMDM